MDYIFIDFEMNPVDDMYRKVRGMCHHEIIEIGAVRLDEEMKQDGTFKRYIKPVYNDEIMERIERLTGINTEKVQEADGLDVVLGEFTDWCAEKGEDYVIYSWSENDLLQIKKEVETKQIETGENFDYMVENWKDFQAEFGHSLGMRKKFSLENAVSFTGKEFEGDMHDALWDAMNTAELFITSHKDKKFMERADMVKKTLEPPKPFTATLGDLLAEKLKQMKS